MKEYNTYKTYEVTYSELDRIDALLATAKHSSYRQSIRYIKNSISDFKRYFTFIISNNDQDIASVTYAMSHFASGLLNHASISNGVIFKYDPTEELILYLVSHFENWAVNKRAVFVSINFWLPALIAGQETGYCKNINNIMFERGFSLLGSGRHTYWLDITRTEKELLDNMKKQTRYDVRAGLKSPITLETKNSSDEQLLADFWALYVNIGQEKKFITLSKKAFIRQIRALLESGHATLFILKYKEVVINISLASNIGISQYLFGAINKDYKSIGGCPSPGPLAQWEMIKYMKSLGRTIYDLGFCPGPEPIQGHPRYSIWRFKYGFGGSHVQYIPTYGKIIKKVRGRLFMYVKYKI